MKNITLAFFILFSFCSLSQEKKIDSLLANISSAKNTDVQIKKLNELARFYLYYSPKKALQYIDKAILLAEENSNLSGEIISNINLGFYYIRIDEYRNSRTILRNALKSAKAINNLALAGEASYLMARANNGIGRYDFSMNKLIQAETFYDSARYYNYMGRVYETMGDLNDKFGNYELAIQNLQESLDLKIKNKDWMELPRTYAYLGNVNLHKGKKRVALNYYKKGLAASEQYHNLNSKAYCLTKIGEFSLAEKEFEKAQGYFLEALNIAISHENNWGIFRNEIGLSEASFELENYEKALKTAIKAIEIAEKIQDDEGLMKGNQILSKIYEKTGNIKEAFSAFKRFSSYEEKLFAKEKTAAITMHEVSHKNKIEYEALEKKKKMRESELKMLQTNQKQKDLLAKKDKEKRELLGIILIVFLVIVVLFSLFQYNRYLAIKKQKQIIQKQSRQNFTLMKTLSNQDKMSTVGEISSNIAHELNSPLGTVKSSAEGIEDSFKNLLENNAWGCPSEEIDYALKYVLEKSEKRILTGKNKLLERKKFLTILEKENIEKNNAKDLANLFASSIIDVSEKEVIKYVLKTKKPGSFLKLLKNINLVLFFIHANLSSSKRVANRVADLRSYLMTEKKEKKKEVNVSKNMETIINLFKQELEKDIDLKITLDKSIQINAFPIMLHQLWSNLLKNAIEALKQKNGPKTLYIKLYSADGFAIIEFINNGPQIENKALDKIFENLYTTKEKSAGLGLGIVKNVVDAHQAKINVRSSAEETCFKIHLKNK